MQIKCIIVLNIGNNFKHPGDISYWKIQNVFQLILLSIVLKVALRWRGITGKDHFIRSSIYGCSGYHNEWIFFVKIILQLFLQKTT